MVQKKRNYKDTQLQTDVSDVRLCVARVAEACRMIYHHHETINQKELITPVSLTARICMERLLTRLLYRHACSRRQ